MNDERSSAAQTASSLDLPKFFRMIFPEEMIDLIHIFNKVTGTVVLELDYRVARMEAVKLLPPKEETMMAQG